MSESMSFTHKALHQHLCTLIKSDGFSCQLIKLFFSFYMLHHYVDSMYINLARKFKWNNFWQALVMQWFQC